MRGEGVGVVFLGGVVFPGVLMEAGSVLEAYFLGLVGGSGVYNDNFVGNAL